jgi:hypothetical protein
MAALHCRTGDDIMQAVFIVLNKTECLEEMLEEFSRNRFFGATILESRGMIREIQENSDISFLLSVRSLLNPNHKESKTIFMVVSDDQIPVVSRIVNDVTGGLDQPDTGILFTIPVGYTEGLPDIHD